MLFDSYVGLPEGTFNVRDLGVSEVLFEFSYEIKIFSNFVATYTADLGGYCDSVERFKDSTGGCEKPGGSQVKLETELAELFG